MPKRGAGVAKENDGYHSKQLEGVLTELKASEKGLTKAEAAERLAASGYNQLEGGKKISRLKIFLSQFQDLIIWILIAAVVISMFLKEFVDSAVILVIILINSIIGFLQEYRAEKAIDALKRLAGLKADVLRDGERQQIDARMLVPGDIIFLEAGNKVPADCRLIEEANLEVQESALTGESAPVRKEVGVSDENAPIAEMRNMVFSATVVTKGRGRAVVARTGMHTEVGRIAKMLEETEEELTPLQKQLDKFGRQIGYVTLAICAIVFLATVVRHEGSILELFKVSVSLAVAAIPEGLPAIVTLSLALGIQRMIKRNALVRKLPSVETLGSTTVICTDKTGTLTVDQMTVKKIYANGEELSVTGQGYSSEGEIEKVNDTVKLLLRIGALCNDAALTKENGEVKGIVGDPTEAALLVSAEKAGVDTGALSEYRRIGEVPFDSGRKMMSTAHSVGGKNVLYTKGAADVVLKLCTHQQFNGRITPLTADSRKKLLEANEELSSQALRVLAFAYKPLKPGQKVDEQAEKGLIFAGLQAMIDPPRREVKDAIVLCRQAGIKVVMITGDHKETARAIGKELGLTGEALTGEDLDKMSDEDLLKKALDIAIYARVSPEHKLRIISAIKKTNNIAAMTGDGVNDAPALKKADIGIAMGVTGTDVAREASKMILTDDNFASIVNAVEEGRGIYENIRKFVYFLLSSNIAEVLVIFVAVVAGLPLPLAAIQLLWINLVTDGLPALALGVEPIEKDIMHRKPRKPEEGILNRQLLTRIALVACTITAGTLGLFYYKLTQSGWRPGAEIQGETHLAAITMAFTALVMFELFNALAAKSERGILFRQLFNNKYLLLAIASSLALQLAVIYLPINVVFDTVPLSGKDLLLVTVVASTLLIVDTAYKLLLARMQKQAQ